MLPEGKAKVGSPLCLKCPSSARKVMGCLRANTVSTWSHLNERRDRDAP